MSEVVRDSSPLNPVSGRQGATRPICDGDLPDISDSARDEDIETTLKTGVSTRCDDSGKRARRAALLGFLTLASRFLGLYRDRLFAVVFGAGAALDAFFIAFTVPNLLRRLFGEGALSSAFVPVFVGQRETGNEAGAQKTANVVFTKLALWLGVIVALGEVGLGIAVAVLPDSSESTRALLELTMITLPYALFINLAALMAGILNSYRHFVTPALAPIVLNCVLIAALYIFRNDASDKAALSKDMAYALLVAGVAQLLIQLPSALLKGFRIKPSLDRTDNGYKEIMRNFIPVVAGVAVFQVNTLADRLMAQFLIPGNGAVSVLFLSNRLMQLPLALASIALATVALPELSGYWARGEFKPFIRNLLVVVRQNLFFIIPASAMLIVCGTAMASLAFAGGEMDKENEAVFGARACPDTMRYVEKIERANGRAYRVYETTDGERFEPGRQPKQPLVRPDSDSPWRYPYNEKSVFERIGASSIFYGFGLLFISASSIIARAFYAMKDTRTPMRTAVYAMLLNLVLNLLFILTTDYGEAGLALASAIASAVQTIAMAIILFRRVSHFETNADGGMSPVELLIDWTKYYIGGSIASGIVVWFINAKLSVNEDLAGFISFVVCVIVFSSIMTTISNRWLKKHTPDGKPENAPPGVAFLVSVYLMLLLGVITGLVMEMVKASLPDGSTLALRLQYCLVPLLFGGLAWMFGAGNYQLEEYESFRAAIGLKPLKK